MFNKSSQIIIDKENLSNYIDGFDVYNSKLLTMLNDPSIKRECYRITNFSYRPDLIAEDFYGSTKYTGILILTSGIGLENFKKDTVLELIPKNELDKIINKL